MRPRSALFVRADSKRGEVSGGSCRNHAGSQPILDVFSYDGRMRYAPGLQLDRCAPKGEKPSEVRHIGSVGVVLCEQFDRDVGEKTFPVELRQNERLICRILLVESRYSKQRRPHVRHLRHRRNGSTCRVRSVATSAAWKPVEETVRALRSAFIHTGSEERSFNGTGRCLELTFHERTSDH